jgi:hypothetical protein
MVLIHWHSGSKLSFIVIVVLEHSFLPRAIQNTSISNDPLKAYSLGKGKVVPVLN